MPVVCGSCGLLHNPDCEIEGRVCCACGDKLIRIPTPKKTVTVMSGWGISAMIFLPIVGGIVFNSMSVAVVFLVVGFCIALVTAKQTQREVDPYKE